MGLHSSSDVECLIYIMFVMLKFSASYYANMCLVIIAKNDLA